MPGPPGRLRSSNLSWLLLAQAAAAPSGGTIGGANAEALAKGFETHPVEWFLAVTLFAIVVLFGFVMRSNGVIRTREEKAMALVEVARDEKLKLVEAHGVELKQLAVIANTTSTEYRLLTDGLGGLITENLRVLKLLGSKNPNVREALRRAEADAGSAAVERAGERFTKKEPTVPVPVVPPGG